MKVRDQLHEVQLDPTTNLALWLDRFVPDSTSQAAVRMHHDGVGKRSAPEGYKRAYDARWRTLMALDGGFSGGETRFFHAKLTGRAVIGIGAASVRETSLTLLRPWGVPYIPGSALKGVASQVAHSAGGEWRRPERPGEPAGSLHALLFGDIHVAGSVVFHDAWWVPSNEDLLPVHADTMTVHHGEYYRGQRAPSDTDEPTPVSFLTINGTYLVALSGPGPAIDVAAAVLRRGLEERGIGAKTAAGYGRATLSEYQPPLSREERLRRAHERRRATMSTAELAEWAKTHWRTPEEGATETEWRASLREALPPEVIEHLRSAGSDDDAVATLEARIEQHRREKPKEKRGRKFNRWRDERDRLEKELAKARSAASNRAHEQGRADELLRWLDSDGEETER